MDRNYQSHFCSYCGTKLDNDAKFCKTCGKPVFQAAQANTEFRTTNERSEKAFSHEPNTERKTVYDGELHKCPNCGDIIDAYETVCESCGYEIRGRKTSSAVHELAMKLESTYDAKKREELIRNFYIPNTKEDIYEFFILATSNIKVGSADSKAWVAKLEQAYQKAQLTLGNTKEFEYFKTLYAKAQIAKKTNLLFRLSKSGYFWALLFAVIGGLMVALSGESSMTLPVGLFSLAGGMWIGLMTAIKNQKDKDDD